jgi:hypothetical protein
MIGQDPMAQAKQAAGMAHLSEHIAFEYRRQIEEQLGVPYPAPDEEMSEEMEVQISRLAAAAAQKVLQSNTAMAAQQQAQQAQQDPIVQMQQQELQMKQQEVQMKQQDQEFKVQVAQQDQALKELRLQMEVQAKQQDQIAKTEQLQVERERIASQERIAGLQLGTKVGAEKAKLKATHELEGTRMGLDMGRELFNRDNPKKENKPQGKA